MTITKPRPMHMMHREIRSVPDASEPSYAQEQESFQPREEDDVEDEFHRRLQGSNRRDSGGSSFWRTTSTSSAVSIGEMTVPSSSGRQQSTASSTEPPAFSSMSMKSTTPSIAPRNRSDGLSASNRTTSSATSSTTPEVQASWNQGDEPQPRFRRKDSGGAGCLTPPGSSNSRGTKKKDASRQRNEARRKKMEAQHSDLESGGYEETPAANSSSSHSTGGLPQMPSTPLAEASRGSSGEGSLLYGKTLNPPRNSGVLLGKSSSLIFPTGVESSSAMESEANAKRRKVSMLLDQCEANRFVFKKKLILANMHLAADDLPLKDLCGTHLGNSLSKLSLQGNRLGTVPSQLVQSLPTLKTLDLSQCELYQLPSKWNLSQLKRLVLSHNRLTDFPEESMLEGLPELNELDLYGNKVAEIIVPHNPRLLSKLESLNMGYNDLAYIPEELDQWKSLRHLKVMNNVLEKVPMRVVEMDLRSIDVSNNPVVDPPVETCERGINSMKLYYRALRREEKEAAARHRHNSQRQQQHAKPSNKRGKLFGAVKKPPNLFSSSKAKSDSTVVTSSNHSAAALPAKKEPRGVSAPSSFVPKPTAEDETNKRSTTTSTASSPGVASSSTPSTPILTSKQKREAWQEHAATSNVSDASTTASEKRILGGTTAITVSPPVVEEPSLKDAVPEEHPTKSIAINDTLKVIFVGMAMAGKTSMIKRLMEGKDAVIPKRDERTIGVDIYEWDPKRDARFNHIDSRIAGHEDVNVKFSVWDFAGQHVYHATHELFFSPRALYVLVWDMGANNDATFRRKSSHASCEGGVNRGNKGRQDYYDRDHNQGPFQLYDSSEEERDDDDDEDDTEDDFYAAEEEARRADRALERDIDEKVQFWVNCIQSSAPGAAILPVASFDDYFRNNNDEDEAKRRCRLLKERLTRLEERRIQGIKDRLQTYNDSNRANDEGADQLRKLLSDFSRPKLIFGNDDDGGGNCVVRVSGTEYTGFAHLTEKIVSIATGRDKAGWRFNIYKGHVGVRIPRMRLHVREMVRKMRDKFKVVEWGYFIQQLREHKGITSVDDINEALHFLTNVGELSYFGSVEVSQRQRQQPQRLRPGQDEDDDEYDDRITTEDDKGIGMRRRSASSDDDFDEDDDEDDDDDDYDIDDEPALSIDDTTSGFTSPVTEDGSLSSMGDLTTAGLSQFVFLNPRWLVAAVACILRHDLDREIQETRRIAGNTTPNQRMVTFAGSTSTSLASFYDAYLNCPLITADDACMLWQAKKFTKKAAERALEVASNMTMTPFEFLQLLLIRFGVFVPIDLSIEKAFLGGKEYSLQKGAWDLPPPAVALEIPTQSPPSVLDAAATEHAKEQDEADDAESASSSLKSRFFFLPSLLGPGEPSEMWTYKNTDSWKTTLCHSILFPDGVPPGLMERITAMVLSNVYAVTHRNEPLECRGPDGRPTTVVPEGTLTVKEVLCWRTAFFIKLGTQVVDQVNGVTKESVVEVFTHLADRDSHLCVGSDHMGIGMRRLVSSAKGQVGDGGRKIWKGGYMLVLKAIGRVMEEYGGLEFERQGFCPECLAKKAVSEASCWNFTMIRNAVSNSETTLHCRHGHRVDTRFLAGPLAMEAAANKRHGRHSRNSLSQEHEPLNALTPSNGDSNPVVPVKDLLRGVVVVGLWDGKLRKIVRVGSGFVVDKKRGLIVTASHTLMNIWGDRNTPFGEDYYGLRQGKVVIGVIPRGSKKGDEEVGTMAMFRYFAKIVAKDRSMEDHKVCHLDVCVLRITTRLENDVGGNGDGCGDQPERLLLNNPEALKREKLQQLRVTDKCELDEQVRILGFNQGGEGLLGPGESLNRYVDFARGYVCKKFATGTGGASTEHAQQRFQPREEIVVICPTIGGHSGGPCVNQQGEVIGILSRADPAETQRCYLVPSYEWKDLVKQAKNKL